MLGVALVVTGSIGFALATHPSTDISSIEQLFSALACVASGLLGTAKLIADITSALHQED